MHEERLKASTMKALKQEMHMSRQYNKNKFKEHEKRLDHLHQQSRQILDGLELSQVKADDVDTKSSLIAKLRRNWAEEDVRVKYNKAVDRNARKNNEQGWKDCDREEKEQMIVFSAVPL